VAPSDSTLPDGPALQRDRDYLAFLTRFLLGPGLRGRVDLSGVVQETLLEVHRAAAALDGLPEADRLAWLRLALKRNLVDQVRRLGAARRDAGREVALADVLERSSAQLERFLAVDQPSPADIASKNEQVLRLAEALAQLPDDQRTAVELRYLHGRSVTEVAQALQRGPGAAAAILVRGLRRLRKLLSAGNSESGYG
jgi:RNA polymerase sigma-70 factor, ECF subfamily